MTILHNWADVTEEAAGAIGKRRINGTGADLVLITIPAGTEAERHSHAFEQFVHVVSGKGVLETRDGAHAFAAGHVFHFPPDTWHAARFDEDTILVEVNLAAA